MPAANTFIDLTQMSAAAIVSVINDAEPGSVFCYHIGDLASARFCPNSKSLDVHKRAAQIWSMSEREVLLCQKRKGPRSFYYLAVRRNAFAKRVPDGFAAAR